jgi:transposase-like protein
MDYQIDYLLDEDKCYDHLVEQFHNGDLRCAGCGSSNYRTHKRNQAPILQHKCKDWRRYFNLFTGTAFEGSSWRCSQVVMILRGFAQGASTLHMSREMGYGF